MSFRRPPKEVPESTLPASTVSLKDVLEVGAGRGSRRLLPCANVAGVKANQGIFTYTIGQYELQVLLSKSTSPQLVVFEIEANDKHHVYRGTNDASRIDPITTSENLYVELFKYQLAIQASVSDKQFTTVFWPALEAVFQIMTDGCKEKLGYSLITWENDITYGRSVIVAQMNVSGRSKMVRSSLGRFISLHTKMKQVKS